VVSLNQESPSVNGGECQYSIAVNNNDSETGSLNKPSNIRPNRIFTADQSIILSIAGHLKAVKTNQAIGKIIEILNMP